MLDMQRIVLTSAFLLLVFQVEAQGPGPGPGYKIPTIEPYKYTEQMQSRAVDTRVTFEISEGQAKGTLAGRIPTKPGFTYRFNEAPREFILDPITGEIKTNVILDREILKNDRYDLVVLSSQPTYPIEVRILVMDINDNSPEFPEASIAVSFSESAVSGTRLLLDAATDKDIGINGISDNYKIIAGNENQKFRLVVTTNPTGDSSYLHLETTGKLDRETQGFYTLNISAQDGGNPSRYGYLQVNVTILDVNDNPPIFDHSDYIVSLNESVSPGSPVLQVMATDNDLGDNAKITYYLNDLERQFSVDPETGIISTTESLHCPQQNCPQPSKRGASCPKSCVFTVFARDHGVPRQDGRTYVTVNLLDANDHSPVIKFRYFPATAGFATVDENAGNGSVVAAVSVVDQDDGLNGETTVKIVAGNELNNFRLDYTPSFDIVRVNGVLDREEISKYNLTVVATDKGNPPRTATAFLIIHVNDVNDHEPVFEKSEYSAILSELAPPGTYVAGITATDEDTGVNAQIYYAFVSGNENQWFQINQDSGLITTQAPLDREVQGTVELNISAKDGGPNPKWAYTQLKVTILDENDDSPEFSQSKINVSLSERTHAGTLVAMLTATDRDQGTNGSVTYSLHPNVKQKYEDTFFLDPLTGQLTTRKKLDREEISMYEIQIIARDQGIPPQSSTATVFLTILDENDNIPEFYPEKYFVPIADNLKPGTSVLKVTADDKDEGENSMVTYKLEQEEDSLFSIDEFTGVITLRGSLKSSPKSMYRLQVSAKDYGDNRADDMAIIEIMKESNIEELQFDNYGGYEFQILEDHGENSIFKRRDVGTVRVGNNDAIYFIVYGDPNKNFYINEHTGKITTAKKIDREQSITYSLTVVARARNSYGKCTVNIVVQDLNDNKPTFQKYKDEISLLENAAVGQEVYLARARDLDSGINSRITYKLNYNPEDQFRISEATGVIYLNKPIRSEPSSLLHVEVTATDSGVPPLSSKLTLDITIADVNDHTPVFDHTSYETSLLESTPVNERFFALAASDADLDLNGRIIYEIIEGNGEQKFGVFPDGFLYLRKSLDREEKDYYSLTVMAKDMGSPSRFSVVPVVIHVIDENDNAPQFTNTTFTFQVLENQPVDSFVGKLRATDKDIGRNAELIFSLSPLQTDFAIDPKNGFIRTLRVFDREDLVQTQGHNFITLEATVTDNGSPRLKDKVKVNVYVTDENDNAPKFLRTPYKVQVSEGSRVGAQILRLYTQDIDEGLNGDVYYSIIGGNEDRRFDIEEATGQIHLTKRLDRETKSKYILKILAHDAGLTKQLSTTTTVQIEVLDENDNAPEFTQSESKISISEITSMNTELIQFKAIDNDLGVNSEVVYSITAGNRKDTFHIDATTGILYLHKNLDYEELSGYQLNITASDNGSPRLFTTILFSISVEDANDNPPSFPSTAIVRQIKEGIPVHTPIVTVTADDPDYGINGKVTYSISYQEPEDANRHFGINPITGVIHTLRPIDRETIDTFRLTVVATDMASPPSTRLSADKLVTVIVEDINDNMPIFVSMSAAILPQQNEKFYRQGITVMNVFARDLDSATNGLVTYELVSDPSELFMLDQSSGALKLKKPLTNPEPTYRLSVKATDEAVQSERRSSEAYVTILAESSRTNTGPTFDNSIFSGSVFENEPPGTSILTVSAKYSKDEIEYYITNVTGDGVQVDRLFDIDTKLGVLSTATELDREVGVDTYVVEVYAIVVGDRSPRTSFTKEDRIQWLTSLSTFGPKCVNVWSFLDFINMPRGTKLKNYDPEAMKAALADCDRGIPVSTSAKKNNVPRITLLYKFKGKYPESEIGRKSYLTKEEENFLVSWILQVAKAGFPVGKTQLLDSVQHLMVDLKRENPFKDNRPGKSWYKLFLKRHPEIAIRTPQNLTSSRANVTKEQLDRWFHEVLSYLKEDNYDHILEHPERVYNGDETAFFLNPKGEKILARKGDKTIYQVVNSDEKECLTVLVTGNAAGTLVSPMIIFKYERIPKELAISVPDEWGIGKSSTGWMTSEAFFEYISNIFYPWLLQNNIELPVILFIDGYGSHLTLHTSKFCKQHGIILVALFPNATHKLQPMDFAVFRTLKMGWKQNVHQWRLDHTGYPILKKADFCALLKKTIDERMDTNILKNGFRTCGLVPWNPAAVHCKKEEKHNPAEKKNRLTELQNGKLFLENNIDSQKIKAFKESKNWEGNINDLSLFTFYNDVTTEIRTLKQELLQTVINTDQKLDIGQEVELLEKENNTFIENLDTRIDVMEEQSQKKNVNKETINNPPGSYQGISTEQSQVDIFSPLELLNKSEKNTSTDGKVNQTREGENLNGENYKRSEDMQKSKSNEQILLDISCSSPKNSQNVKPSLKPSSSQIIPSPFKRVLFWPEPQIIKNKRAKKEKIPSVVTSRDWQAYYEKKENEKKVKEEDKIKRAEERKKKKELMEEQKKIKKKEQNSVQNVKKNKSKLHNKKEISSDSETSVEWEESDHTSDENMSFSDLENVGNFKENDYVIVSFPGKKKNHRYVCVIQQLLPSNEAEVVAMIKCEDGKFKLNADDVSVISLDQVVQKLKFPKISASGDRLKYDFGNDLDVAG